MTLTTTDQLLTIVQATAVLEAAATRLAELAKAAYENGEEWPQKVQRGNNRRYVAPLEVWRELLERGQKAGPGPYAGQRVAAPVVRQDGQRYCPKCAVVGKAVLLYREEYLLAASGVQGQAWACLCGYRWEG